MQAITALAHLQCCVLYFLDISEQCGYPIDQQLKLFESIRPLFANKQVIMVANKVDVLPFEKLAPHVRQNIEDCANNAHATLIPMSNISEENIGTLKVTACDMLLEARVDSKLSAGRIKNDIMSRITVVNPKPRDDIQRDACIPESVAVNQVAEKSSRVTEKTLMWNNGGPGVYVCDYRKYYGLNDDEWKFDAIPEFMDGKNIADFFDDDIEEKLNALEEEEAELAASGAYEVEEDEGDEDLDEEDMLLYEAIREKQIVSRNQSHQTKQNLPRKVTIRNMSEAVIKDQLEAVGLESQGVIEHTRGRKRERSVVPSNETDMDVDECENKKLAKKRSLSKSVQRNRTHSATRGSREGSVAPHQEKQVAKSKKILDRKIFRYARSGESDREHYPKLVKHLNSGKRSLGTSTIGR
jgi:nucleolar GTP-binding protein